MIMLVRKILGKSVHLSEFKIQRFCASFFTYSALEQSQLNVCFWTFVYHLPLAYMGTFSRHV